MKKLMLKWVLLCLVFICGMAAYAEDVQDFIENVNSAWTNRNYAGIMSNINARLAVDSNDVLALGLRMNYYIFAELNASNAHGAALSFSNAVHRTGRQDMFPLASNMYHRILNVEETNTYSSAQRDKIHEMFPERCPSIVENVSFYVMLSRTNAPGGN